MIGDISRNPVDIRTLRVDQVGSLACPPELRNAFAAFDLGHMTAEDLERIKDAAVVATLRKQDQIGFPVVTDGELRRRNWQDSFAGAVTGFDVPDRVSYDLVRDLGVSTKPLARAEQDFAAAGPAILTRRPVRERLRLTRNVPLKEFEFAKCHTSSTLKATILSPDRIVQRYDHENSRGIYKDKDAFLADVIAINREIIRGLVEAGCRYIQVDAPGYTAYVDEISLNRMRARGEDPEANLRRSINAENAMIEGFPGVTFGIHVCRGNARTRDPATGKLVAQFHREGHYDAIAERLFTSLNHHRWLLEYDSDRAGGFEPLRFMPKGRVAVLGLVSTKANEIESLDFLRQRVEIASRFIDLSQLALSPQCGFGGSWAENVEIDEQWKKFERMMEAARLIWN